MRFLNSSMLTSGIVYVFSDIITKAIPFLILPILIKIMSIDDYASYSIFIQLSNVLIVLIGFGTYSAVNMCYYKGWFEYDVYHGAFIILSIAIAILLCFMSFFFHDWLVVICAVAFGLLSCLIQIKLVELQNLKKKWNFLTLQFVKMLFFALGSVGVYYLNKKLTAMYIYIISFSLLLCLYLCYNDRYKIKSVLRYSFSYYLKIVKHGIIFAFPSFINSISGWIRNGIDRFFILSLMSLSYVALVSFAFQIASVISIIGISINRTVNVNLLNKYKKLDFFEARLECKKMSLLVGGILTIVSLILYFSITLIDANSNMFSNFRDTFSFLVPILLASFVLQGVCGVYSSFLQYYGGNRILGISSLSIGIIYIPLSYVAIRTFNYTSVGLVFFISWVFQIYIAYLFMNKKKRLY